MSFDTLLHTLAGPVIGAVIGYTTNYIAIKMLFRPLTPKYLFGLRVPFTPGIIPRRKTQLADALGKAVFAKFFNWDDLEEVFLSEAFCDRVCQRVLRSLRSDAPLGDTVSNIPQQTVEQIKNAVAEQVRHSMVCQGYAGLAPVAASVVRQLFDERRDTLAQLPKSQLVQTFFGPDDAALEAGLRNVYMTFMRENVRPIVESIDIVTQITGKMNSMGAGEVESLVLDIVSRELRMVVWFGAFLGALIGVINIFL